MSATPTQPLYLTVGMRPKRAELPRPVGRGSRPLRPWSSPSRSPRPSAPARRSRTRSRPRGRSTRRRATKRRRVARPPPAGPGHRARRQGGRRQVPRALSARAGPRSEAEAAFAGVVAVDPMYLPDTREVAPSVRAFFREVRRRMLPGLARERYTGAKALYDGGEFRKAVGQFAGALQLLDDPDMEPGHDDLREMVAGFRELAEAKAPPEPARRPAPPRRPRPRRRPSARRGRRSAVAGRRAAGRARPEPAVAAVRGAADGASKARTRRIIDSTAASNRSSCAARFSPLTTATSSPRAPGGATSPPAEAASRSSSGE